MSILAAAGHETGTLDVARVRRDFPILGEMIHGHPLTYLDNAATTQKPRQVIEAIRRFYEEDNSNVHRGVHTLSERATEAYEAARAKIRAFLNARKASEIIFVRGATEGINLVASSFGRSRIHAGDEILLTGMEHHSNIVPWQILGEEKGAVLKIVPVTDRGEIEISEFERLLSPRTKLVGVVHVSNALGTVNPVKEMIEIAHRHGVPVLVDGAQAAPHLPVDVRALDCDFFVFSGHKVYGPTGAGVLYGKEALLDALPPYQGGGDMISSVTFAKTSYNVLPYKFEAGTPNVAGAVGLGAALDYVKAIGLPAIAAHEADLLEYATQTLEQIPGLTIIGTARHKAGAISFVLDGIHPHDVGTILDGEGIAIRTGHHCAQPVMERFGLPATARASFALYNTREEIDRLALGLRKVREVFRP